MAALTLAFLLMLIPHVQIPLTLSTDSPAIIPVFLSHFAHWSWNHFTWDAIAFAALCWLYESGNWRSFPGLSSRKKAVAISAGKLGFSIIFCAGFISIIVCAFPLGVLHYRGLSGLCTAVYGLILFTALSEALTSRDKAAGVACLGCLALFLAKLAYEFICNAALFVDTEGFMVVPAAHFAGISAAGLVASVSFVREQAGAAAAPVR